MKSIILAAVSLSLYAALPAAADTLVLRSGEVLIADVLEVGEGTLELDAGYPRRAKTVIQWDELMPESVYSVLARRSFHKLLLDFIFVSFPSLEGSARVATPRLRSIKHSHPKQILRHRGSWIGGSK